MTNTNTGITPELIVQKARRLLYPAHTTDDMVLEHALADPDSFIVKNLKKYHPNDCISLDALCLRYENVLLFLENQVQTKAISGCMHNDHYYPDPSYAGKSIEETIEGLQPKYERQQQQTKRRRNITKYTAAVLNAPGLLLAAIPVKVFDETIGKDITPGTGGSLAPLIVIGWLGFAALGTVATTTALAMYNLPMGIAYGVAALGSGIAWYNSEFNSDRESKDVKGYEYLIKTNNRYNLALKKKLHELMLAPSSR